MSIEKWWIWIWYRPVELTKQKKYKKKLFAKHPKPVELCKAILWRPMQGRKRVKKASSKPSRTTQCRTLRRTMQGTKKRWRKTSPKMWIPKLIKKKGRWAEIWPDQWVLEDFFCATFNDIVRRTCWKSTPITSMWIPCTNFARGSRIGPGTSTMKRQLLASQWASHYCKSTCVSGDS